MESVDDWVVAIHQLTSLSMFRRNSFHTKTDRMQAFQLICILGAQTRWHMDPHPQLLYKHWLDTDLQKAHINGILDSLGLTLMTSLSNIFLNEWFIELEERWILLLIKTAQLQFKKLVTINTITKFIENPNIRYVQCIVCGMMLNKNNMVDHMEFSCATVWMCKDCSTLLNKSTQKCLCSIDQSSSPQSETHPLSYEFP